MSTSELLKKAKAVKAAAASLDTETKNKALLLMADELEASSDEIIRENAKDTEAARESVSEVMLDRLRLDRQRICAMAKGIREVAALPDPVGRIISSRKREDGLLIDKVSCPIGLVAIIYESRPNVTSDAAALLLKSGNVCVLKGGKEARLSCLAIVKAMRRALKKAGLPEELINILEDCSRQGAEELMQAVGYVDLLIPRGGKGLIKACTENARVPCIETGTGICHVYVDAAADTDKALRIIYNAKTSRPSVCNAEEVCLVHSSLAEDFLPLLKKVLRDDREKDPVELRLDERAIKIIEGSPAGEEDFDTEFLDYILAVKIVDSLDEAIEHIALHSSGHSEAIVTEDSSAAERFCLRVDSAAVYVNASTRFTDGGEFGLGCEMGISTQKLHARGPMGLEELNSFKYVIHGNGHVR